MDAQDSKINHEERMELMKTALDCMRQFDTMAKTFWDAVQTMKILNINPSAYVDGGMIRHLEMHLATLNTASAMFNAMATCIWEGDYVHERNRQNEG